MNSKKEILVKTINNAQGFFNATVTYGSEKTTFNADQLLLQLVHFPEIEKHFWHFYAIANPIDDGKQRFHQINSSFDLGIQTGTYTFSKGSTPSMTAYPEVYIPEVFYFDSDSGSMEFNFDTVAQKMSATFTFESNKSEIPFRAEGSFEVIGVDHVLSNKIGWAGN